MCVAVSPEELRVEGLLLRLLQEGGAGEEEEEEEVAGEEVRAPDRGGEGEASRSLDSISVKHNPISSVTKAGEEKRRLSHSHTHTHTHTCVRSHTLSLSLSLYHTYARMDAQTITAPLSLSHTHTHTHTPSPTHPPLCLSHLTSSEQFFYLGCLAAGMRLAVWSCVEREGLFYRGPGPVMLPVSTHSFRDTQ